MPSANFSPPCRRDTGMSCCDGIRLDGRTLALLEHVLVLRGASRAAPFTSTEESRWQTIGKTITDEQFAARELVRDWAATSGATAAVRAIEQGEPDAWRPVFGGLTDLGLVRCRGPRGLRRGRRQHRGPVRDGRRGRQSPGARPGGDDRAGHAGGRRSAVARRTRVGRTHRRGGTRR